MTAQKLADLLADVRSQMVTLLVHLPHSDRHLGRSQIGYRDGLQNGVAHDDHDILQTKPANDAGTYKREIRPTSRNILFGEQALTEHSETITRFDPRKRRETAPEQRRGRVQMLQSARRGTRCAGKLAKPSCALELVGPFGVSCAVDCERNHAYAHCPRFHGSVWVVARGQCAAPASPGAILGHVGTQPRPLS